MILKYLIQKELLQIRRNSFLPRLIIIFPIMVMCVMPWVMNMEVKNIKVDVVDLDHSTQSEHLVQAIVHNTYFIFHEQKNTYAEALKNIERTETDIIVVIPKHYAKDLKQGRLPEVCIAANAVNGTKAAMGSTYLSQIVTTYAYPDVTNLQKQISTLFLYNKHLNFKLFMIPALLAIVTMLLTGYLPALNIVGEKEQGTIEQINVTPIKNWAFILAKLIPYWGIAIFAITACLLLAWLIYGITPVGSIWLVYLLAILLTIFFSSFGLIISNHSDTMQQAVFVMWFFVVILILLSGLFTPTRSMPTWAYATTYINPVAYFIDAVRTVFIRGGDFLAVRHQVLALIGIDITMAVWAVTSYRKNH